MRPLSYGLLFALLVTSVSAGADTTSDPAAEARAISMELGTRLKAALQAAVAAGGPVAAINTCHEQALPITDALGKERGWKVGRTSLRVRNPANAPDNWETAVLEDFLRRQAAGTPIAEIEDSGVFPVEGGHEFRYMKAIPVAEACTACHGTTIAPAVQDVIRALYPDDRATGFSAGEIRGAFTLRKRID